MLVFFPKDVCLREVQIFCLYYILTTYVDEFLHSCNFFFIFLFNFFFLAFVDFKYIFSLFIFIFMALPNLFFIGYHEIMFEDKGTKLSEFF